MSILSSTNSGIYSTISAPLLRSRGYEEVEKRRWSKHSMEVKAFTDISNQTKR
jgi:hypothetical protein